MADVSENTVEAPVEEVKEMEKMSPEQAMMQELYGLDSMINLQKKRLAMTMISLANMTLNTLPNPNAEETKDMKGIHIPKRLLTIEDLKNVAPIVAAFMRAAADANSLGSPQMPMGMGPMGMRNFPMS